MQGTLALTFAVRSQRFPVREPGKGPCRVSSLGHTRPHLEDEWRPHPLPRLRGDIAHIALKGPFLAYFSATLLGIPAVSSEAGSTISGFPGISGGKIQSEACFLKVLTLQAVEVRGSCSTGPRVKGGDKWRLFLKWKAT